MIKANEKNLRELLSANVSLKAIESHMAVVPKIWTMC
jgi:hypothetical protein